MASGKSLELATITRRQGQAKCICGASYSDHMRKDGSAPLAKYADQSKHHPMIALVYMNRKQKRGYHGPLHSGD